MNYFLSLLSLLFSYVLVAQVDSTQFTTAEWEKTVITKQVELYRHHFIDNSLFNSNQYISYVLIDRQWGKPDFDIVAHSSTLFKTSEFAKNNNAIAAMNGNFFDVKNGGSVSYVRDECIEVNQNRIGPNGRSFHQKAAIVIRNDRVEIWEWDGKENWENQIKSRNLFLNGPILIKNNEERSLADHPFNSNRHPRSCMGIKENGDIVFLVVDGRSEQSAGVSLFELTKILKWLGCVEAVNFDGGGSSTLWVKGLGVVNHPSDNKKWDHKGEREVANVLLIQ